MGNNQERPTETIKIEIYKTHPLAFYVAYLRIKNIADKEKFVPSQLIHDFISRIKIPAKMPIDQVRKMIAHFTEDTLSYFKKQKDKKYYNESLEKIIEETYGYAYVKHIERMKKGKAKRLIYKYVSYQSDKMLKSKYRYGHYRKCVIAGYIASMYGFTPTQEEHDDDAYNELLYDRMKRCNK